MELLHLFIITSLLLLILINIYNYFKSKLREGITSNINSNKYQNYDELENKDPMFLAIKNAANISYIKTQLDELKGIKQEIFDLSNNVYNNETWSSASIDRIDSTQPYSYDNIEIISSYYNTQVKNCASHSQIGKLYYYQLKKLLSKKISKELVKSMSDDELYEVSDMFSVYFKLFEIVSDNSTILHKEMVRRDKKSKLVVKI